MTWYAWISERINAFRLPCSPGQRGHFFPTVMDWSSYQSALRSAEKIAV